MYKYLYIKINTIYMDKLLSCMHLIKKTAAKIFNLFLKPTNLSILQNIIPQNLWYRHFLISVTIWSMFFAVFCENSKANANI